MATVSRWPPTGCNSIRTFRFTDAQALVPYFSRLGITHVYASPILRARQASTHGYDVVDPKTINPNLGDKTDLVNLVTDLRNFGLGLMLDIVPNHMAASMENPYWRDVLTYGHSSPFAGWFDIDWRMPDPDMWGRVLVPVLGEPRARVLEQDQIQLAWSDGRFLVRYFEHVFPVDPATVPTICEFGLDESQGKSVGRDIRRWTRSTEILAQLKKLPKLAARLRRHVDIDREETEQWLAQFAQIVIQSPLIQQWVEETAERFGEGEDGRHRLKKLLDKPALSPGALARRRADDQLSPVLRHQRVDLDSPGRPAGLRRNARHRSPLGRATA